MSASMVVQSAIQAFDDARNAPQKQTSLASQRQMEPALFADLSETLSIISVASDILVHSANPVIGNRVELSGNQVANWATQYPEGVAFPITVATQTDTGMIAAPMRIILMVPLTTSGDLMTRTKKVAHKRVTEIWPGQEAQALGPGSLLFFGMFCNADGEWEYGPVAYWVAGKSHSIQPVPKSLSLNSHHVEIEANIKNTDIQTAMETLLFQYVVEDLLILCAR
jgi:hypothetical protein